jgi:predicted PurR-regulated permease PerM
MSKLNDSTSVYDITIRLFFIFLIIGWCLAILYPFISIMLWGLILAPAFLPLHNSLVKLMGGKKKLASFIIVIISLTVIIVPSWFFIDSIFDNIKDMKAEFKADQLTIPPPTEKVKAWPVIGEPLYNTWQGFPIIFLNRFSWAKALQFLCW